MSEMKEKTTIVVPATAKMSSSQWMGDGAPARSQPSGSSWKTVPGL